MANCFCCLDVIHSTRPPRPRRCRVVNQLTLLPSTKRPLYIVGSSSPYLHSSDTRNGSNDAPAGLRIPHFLMLITTATRVLLPLMVLCTLLGRTQALFITPPVFTSSPSLSRLSPACGRSSDALGVQSALFNQNLKSERQGRKRNDSSIRGVRMATSSSASTNTEGDRGGPHGSRPGDSLTREGFLAGTAAMVVTALAPSILTDPTAPPAYDVSQERIFDTRKSSFLPADPERLIVPGEGFSQRIVCLGEMHTHPLHHRMQFNVIKATHSVTRFRGEPLAIGLEMFYRQQQVRSTHDGLGNVLKYRNIYEYVQLLACTSIVRACARSRRTTGWHHLCCGVV